MTTPAKAPETPAVAPAAPIAPSTLPEDDFDAVFDAITSDLPPKADATSPATPATPATPTAAAPAASAAPGAGEATPPEGTPPAEPAAAATTPPEGTPETTPPAEIDWKAKYEALEAERKAAPAPAAPAPAPVAAAPETPPAAPEIQWYKPTEAEAALLAEHAKQWPDIAEAEALRTKQAVYNAVQYVFAQVKKTYDPVLDRFGEMADALEQQLTLTVLERNHTDYATIRDKVEEWVETLPAFMKAGAKATMKDGTPEEVSELVGEYKKAHPVAAAPATPAAPAAPKAELSPAAKKAAGKLTVVDSKRTAATSAPDPNDFEGAWAEATAVK